MQLRYGRGPTVSLARTPNIEPSYVESGLLWKKLCASFRVTQLYFGVVADFLFQSSAGGSANYICDCGLK